jgi:hypothetical protein
MGVVVFARLKIGRLFERVFKNRNDSSRGVVHRERDCPKERKVLISLKLERVELVLGDPLRALVNPMAFDHADLANVRLWGSIVLWQRTLLDPRMCI